MGIQSRPGQVKQIAIGCAYDRATLLKPKVCDGRNCHCGKVRRVAFGAIEVLPEAYLSVEHSGRRLASVEQGTLRLTLSADRLDLECDATPTIRGMIRLGGTQLSPGGKWMYQKQFSRKTAVSCPDPLAPVWAEQLQEGETLAFYERFIVEEISIVEQGRAFNPSTYFRLREDT